MWMTLNHLKTNSAKLARYRFKIQKDIEVFEFRPLCNIPFPLISTYHLHSIIIYLSYQYKPSDGQAISANISGGEEGVVATPLEILTIACLTFCLLLTDRPTLGPLEYKLKVVSICKMHRTGGLEVVVWCSF